jgi:hypothetical protein
VQGAQAPETAAQEQPGCSARRDREESGEHRR